ncbi:hypothetical protein KCU93_g8992, partial [Aureobasidium melanogenum]
MAPLPYQLNTALTVTGGMLGVPTISTPLNMAVSTGWNDQPVATSWHSDLSVSTHWVGAMSTPTADHHRSVSILVVRTEPEPSESDVQYVDESSGVDAGDETSVDEISIDDDDDDNSGDWQTVGDDVGEETTEETSNEDVIEETLDNDDDELQTVDDGSNDETTDDIDSEVVDDASEPVERVGTEASAETIASDLQEKYPDMPTSIDDCIDTEDEIVTYTDDNGNVSGTVNCTALANMETWYFLPCDDKCRKDLKKIIPAVVVESGIAGGLLPTILNNRGLLSGSPATQNAVVEWLTTQLQQVRNRLSTDWFNWSSVRRSIKELLHHPPVDTPFEDYPFELDPFEDPIGSDPFGSDPYDSDPSESEPYEGDPPADTPHEYEDPFDTDPLRNAEIDVQEAKAELENLKRGGNEDEIRAAEERLAEKEEVLRRAQEKYPTEAPNENVVPEDPIQPPASIEEETAAATRELQNALEEVRRTYKDYQEVKNDPSSSNADRWLRREDWLEARKELKAVRKHIRDARLPVDDPGAADPNVADADAVQPAKPIDQEEVAKAQEKVDELKELSDKDAQKVETLDEDIQNMLDNPPEAEASAEAVETYEEGLNNLQNLKQSTLEHMAKLKKELRIADRALKKAKGELKVQFPDDPVAGEQPNPYDTVNGEPSKPDDTVEPSEPDDTVEPSEPDDTITEDDYYNGLDGADDPTDDNQTPNDDWKDVDETVDSDEPTEVDEPTAPGSTEAEDPSEVDEPTEVDAPTEDNEDPKSDGSSDGDGGVEVDVPAPGGEPFVPPGVVPPPPPPVPVVSIPGFGDVPAPTKVLQWAAGGLKDAVKELWDLRHSKKKDHKAIEKQEKKVEEKKKKLKEEQEKEAKRQEKKKQEKEEKEHEKKKHDKEQKEQEEKQAAEDKKKSKTLTTAKHSATSTTTTSSSTTKTTSTSTTSTKAPEPTVHHKQHDAEITFHGKHSHKFELYGKDWARGKHDGEKLRSNMESCGMDIKDWEFSYAEDKPEIKTSDWSFYAKGELLRKTAADVRCLNKVIKEANGPANLISETDGVDKADDSDKAAGNTNTAEVSAQITFTDKHFTFYGKGFAKDKNSGEQLKEKMEKCSKVKDWKFYTQKKDHDMQLKKQGWDFYAEGEVKKIKRKCLNEVIQGMGGPMEAIAEDAV